MAPPNSSNKQTGTYIFGILIFAVLAIAIFFGSGVDPQQKGQILRVLCAAGAGLLGTFIGGSIAMRARRLPGWANVPITASGGFALFLIVFIGLKPPPALQVSGPNIEAETDNSPTYTVAAVTPPKASDSAVTNQLPAETKLVVEFGYLHVYLDGSLGKDKWSVWGAVNGMETLIWNHKKDISDDCNDQLSPGPGGDSSACQYSLATNVPVTLKHGDTLTVSFRGTAHDENDEVPKSAETFTEAQNWGLGGETYLIQNKMYRRMGNVNAGQTEYYMYYRIIRP